MKHNYQTIDAAAMALGAPSSVTVAIGEVIVDVREGLLAMAVGTGLQVMAAMMNDEEAATCGPKGKHDPDRVAVRHGSERGSVALGGRQVPIARPRMRAVDGSGELPLPSYELFSNTEVLGRLAMEKMLAGISTRGWQAGLEPVGGQVDQAATGTSKSAISRRFVKTTETALAGLLSKPLGDLDLVALMLDGVHFGEHVCVVALGIGIDGIKHPLTVVEGDTENTTVVTDLLVGLRERGLDTTKPILVVLDGAKALKAAVTRVFDHPMIARCQQHKIENVKNRLPERLKSVVEKQMRTAYHADSALAAEAQLKALAKELERTHPSAAAPQLVPAIERIKRRIGRTPCAVTADRDYGEAKIEDKLRETGVRDVAIPRKSKPNAKRREFEHRRVFRDKVKWRTGCEGRINHLKRSYGWDRTELTGIHGARTST